MTTATATTTPQNENMNNRAARAGPGFQGISLPYSVKQHELTKFKYMNRIERLQLEHICFKNSVLEEYSQP